MGDSASAVLQGPESVATGRDGEQRSGGAVAELPTTDASGPMELPVVVVSFIFVTLRSLVWVPWFRRPLSQDSAPFLFLGGRHRTNFAREGEARDAAGWRELLRIRPDLSAADGALRPATRTLRDGRHDVLLFREDLAS